MTFRYAAKVRANNIKSIVIFLIVFAYIPFLLSMHDAKRKKTEDLGIEDLATIDAFESKKIFNKVNKKLTFGDLEKLDPSLRDQVVQQTDKMGNSLVHTCALLGKLKKVQYLFSIGANLKKKNKKGEKPIILAAQGGHMNVVEFLFENCDFDQAFDATMLIRCLVQIPDERAVKFFKENLHNDFIAWPGKLYDTVEGGGHIDFLDFFWQQKAEQGEMEELVSIAAENGHALHLKKLIEYGCDFHAPNASGYPPLWLASYNGHIPCIEILIDSGALPNDATDRYEDSPLHAAVSKGQYDAVAFLIEKGAEVNKGNDIGDRPIANTGARGDLKMLEFLLSKGASTKSQGFRLLLNSLERGHFDFAEFLLKNKISSADDVGYEPFLSKTCQSVLWVALHYGLVDAVHFLLEHGADANDPSISLDEDTDPRIIKLIKEAKAKKLS
jgi:ankyrin repeat protein